MDFLDQKLQPGITVYLCTLNDQNKIESCLGSLGKNYFQQLIVVDGESDDDSVKIAKKFTDEVYIVKKGFINQINKVLEKTKFQYLIGLEADVLLSKDFIKQFYDEFISSDYQGMQATINCCHLDNYWEKGLNNFYQIHHRIKGEKDIIGGPNIYKTSVREFLHSSLNVQGYGMDTKMAELIKEHNLKVGLGHTIAFNNARLNFHSFMRKYFRYGTGDYEFYSKNCHKWSIFRKTKSILHIFNRYILAYPFFSILKMKFIYIPYLWLSAIVRYFAWGYAALKKK